MRTIEINDEIEVVISHEQLNQLKAQAYNPETHVLLTKSTVEQFKLMGNTVLDLKKELAQLSNLVKLFKLNFSLMTYCVIQFTGTFGLNNEEGTMIRQTILDGEESPMGAIIKNITGMMTKAMMAEANPKAQKEMQDQYRFFLYLPHVAQFYQKQKSEFKFPYAAAELENLPDEVKNELL